MSRSRGLASRSSAADVLSLQNANGSGCPRYRRPVQITSRSSFISFSPYVSRSPVFKPLQRSIKIRWGFVATASLIALCAASPSVVGVSPQGSAGTPRPVRLPHDRAARAISAAASGVTRRRTRVSKDSYGRNQAQSDPGSLFTGKGDRCPVGVDEEGQGGSAGNRSGRRRCGARFRGQSGPGFGWCWKGHVRTGPVHRGQRCAGAAGHLRSRHVHGWHHRRARGHQSVLRLAVSAGEHTARNRPGRQASRHEIGHHRRQHRRQPGHRRAGLGHPTPGPGRRHAQCGSSTCPTARIRPSRTQSDPLAAARRTPGDTASSWSPRRATRDRPPGGSPTPLSTPPSSRSEPPTAATEQTAGPTTTPRSPHSPISEPSRGMSTWSRPARPWCPPANRGSYVDTNYTSGLVSGDTSGNLFRGAEPAKRQPSSPGRLLCCCRPTPP